VHFNTIPLAHIATIHHSSLHHEDALELQVIAIYLHLPLNYDYRRPLQGHTLINPSYEKEKKKSMDIEQKNSWDRRS